MMMKKKMWELFERARRLSVRLAEAVIEGRFSAPELSRWAEDSKEGKETIRRLADPAIRRQLWNQFEDPGKRLAVLKLKKVLHRKKQRMLFMRLGAAAIVVLCLGSIMWLRFSSGMKEESISHILPGTQQALLVLSSGERLELSGITQLREADGTDIIRTGKGEIAYSADSLISGQADTNVLLVPRYGEYAVVLADGTKVKLNSESELRYPTSFTGAQREVFLKGEAYLEVSKSERPFIIHMDGVQVKVYGTRLDVNGYNPEFVRVVLVEGKVGITTKMEEEVILNPAELAEVRPLHGITVKKGINPSYYIAWQNGYFAFEKERLEDILTVLSRWYNFEVLYIRPELKDIRFTASLQKEQSLEYILRQFEKTQSISFRVVGNQIVVQ